MKDHKGKEQINYRYILTSLDTNVDVQYLAEDEDAINQMQK